MDMVKHHKACEEKLQCKLSQLVQTVPGSVKLPSGDHARPDWRKLKRAPTAVVPFSLDNRPLGVRGGPVKW